MIKTKIMALLSVSMIGITTLYAGGDITPTYEPVITEPEPVATPLEPVYYVGGGLAIAGLSRDCPCDDNRRLKDMTYGIALRAGRDITDYIGIEVRYINSFIENDFSEVEHYGIYLKPQWDVSQEANLYGLLGYGKTTVDCDNGRRTVTMTKNGLTYGAGLEFAIQDNIAVWVDGMHLMSGEGTFDTDVNMGTLGLIYRFGNEIFQ